MSDIINFIKENNWTIAVCLAILFFVILIIFRNPITKWLENKKEYTLLTPLWAKEYSKGKKERNKTEHKCRQIIERLLGGKKFDNIRPNFLKSKYTGKNLELDGYNHELKLAFEYNGIQHYKFSPYFHKSKEDFIRQLLRDKEKIELCSKNGIKLIIIPYILKDNELEPFIKMKIRELYATVY